MKSKEGQAKERQRQELVLAMDKCWVRAIQEGKRAYHHLPPEPLRHGAFEQVLDFVLGEHRAVGLETIEGLRQLAEEVKDEDRKSVV